MEIMRDGGREGEREERVREGGNEREEGGEREGKKTVAIPSVLNQLQISREPPLQRALCHGVCRRRRSGSHHGGRGSGRGDVESENQTRRGREGSRGGGSGAKESK